MEIHLVQIRKENCHHDHIPFNVKRNGNIVFSAYTVSKLPPNPQPSLEYDALVNSSWADMDRVEVRAGASVIDVGHLMTKYRTFKYRSFDNQISDI